MEKTAEAVCEPGVLRPLESLPILEVQSRIFRFEQRASDVERAELWNGGPEGVWFSNFDTSKYRSLCNTFR